MAKFSFSFVLIEDVLKKAIMLDTSNAVQESAISAKTVKESDVFFQDKGEFPNCMKLTKITAAFKKGACTLKNN